MTCLLRRRNVSSTLAALRQRTSSIALAHLDDPLQPSGPAPKAAQSAGVLLRGNPISRAARRPVKTRRQSVGSGATFGRFRTVGKACGFGLVAPSRQETNDARAQADTRIVSPRVEDTLGVAIAVSSRKEKFAVRRPGRRAAGEG